MDEKIIIVESRDWRKMKRNYGIDLLRVYSMIGVMTLHILGHGGIREHKGFISKL